MAQDEEMTDAAPEAETAKAGAAPADPAATLKLCAELLDRSVSSKEPRFCARALRLAMSCRADLTPAVVGAFVESALPPTSPGGDILAAVGAPPSGGASAMDTGGDGEAAGEAAEKAAEARAASAPEVEALGWVLAVVVLLDGGKGAEACAAAGAAVSRLGAFNRRTMDMLAARLYSHLSLAHERCGTLASIRPQLLGLYRAATLRHDGLGQETLLNLLLRNYLHYNLYDAAEKLRSKAQRPDAPSNHQYCRYLHYLGRIRAVQLEYTDAKECLQQALRKAPRQARGFQVVTTKWLALVRLLLGEVPERSLFRAPGSRAALQPYFELANAVRLGDLKQFQALQEQHEAAFAADKTTNLISRLRKNVIRTALRRINLSYRCISLKDVAERLGLASVEDTELVVAKAIRDGGVDAQIDHGRGVMLSKDVVDIYSTQEPQGAFHARIAFCLDTHNEAVRAMRYPPDAHKPSLESAEARKERLQQEQELRLIAEEEDEEDW